jgi:acyl-coenzyme A synthetase/AMP-(fatty) acid ligase
MSITEGSDLGALLDAHPAPDDAPLLCTIDATYTAAETRRRVDELAAALTGAGVVARSAVAVRCSGGPAYVRAMFAVWRVGAVLVPVNPRQADAEVERILSVTDPAAVVDDGGVRARVEAARRYGTDDAFVTWTSGTTGAPRAVVHTHGGYLELLDRVLAPLRGRPYDPARPPSPNLVPVSLALNAGIYNVLFGLRAGAALVLLHPFTPADFAELVRRYGIRSTVLPPAAMVMLCDDERVEDLSPLRYVRSITAPLSPLAVRRFVDRFGVTVLNSYGQAEIGEVVGWTAADARDHPDKLGAAGRPHPGVDIKVVDEAGVTLGAGAAGELLVRPPRRATHYAEGGGLEDRVDTDGFVRTGDVARIDVDGFVWIEGRLSDVINRGGNKVFPDEVEEVLRLSPAVAEAAVAAVPDERLGEVPVAFVVGAGGAEVDDDALERLCREHLVPYKVPVAFRQVDALPRSEVGKVLRRRLVEEEG